MNVLNHQLAEQIKRYLGEDYPVDERLQNLLLHIDRTYQSFQSTPAESDPASAQNFWNEASFFSQVIDTSPNLIFVKDEQGNFLFANQAMSDLFGIPKEEIVYQQHQHLYGRSEENSLYDQVDQQVIRRKAVIAVEETFTQANGEVKWFYTLKKPLFLPDGSVAVLGIATDITEQKKTASQLAANELRYRQLVENATDIISYCDHQGFFVYANPVACRVLGYSEEELRTRHYLEFVIPEHREMVEDFYSAQFKQRTTDTYLEFKAIASEGEVIWVGQNVHLMAEGDRITGFHIIARNITKRKLVEEELINARQLAEESMRAKEHFLSVMSHEIRTPLTVVKGMLETALAYDQSLADTRQSIARALQRLEGAIGLANALLRLAEVENLKPTQLQEDVNLVDTILDTVTYFGEKYPQQSIELLLTDEFTNQSSQIRVVGNATLLRTVLVNIIDNACKYSAFKPVTVQVQYESSWVLINVLDGGIGIPGAQLADVFLPMMRAGNVSTIEGFGLGLTLAKKIVDMHQGELAVDSVPGSGTRVSLRLRALPL